MLSCRSEGEQSVQGCADASKMEGDHNSDNFSDSNCEDKDGFWYRANALAAGFLHRCSRLLGSNLEEQLQTLRTVGWVAVVTICAYFTAVQVPT